ncbi:MAG: HAMP domain-containing protein [Granulosicoccus sp.]
MARSSDARFPLSLVRDKAFQVRQIRRVLILTLFFIVQSTLILGVFYHTFLGNLVEGNAPLLFASEDMGGLGDSIPAMSSVLSKWMLVMLLVNGIICTGIAIYILRKLGNPILAIRRALNEIGDGNLEVRLRTNDKREFNELCDALNRALEQVHSKISEARSLTRVLETLDDQPAPDDEAVRKALVECRDVLSYFDGTPDAGNEASMSDDQVKRS